MLRIWEKEILEYLVDGWGWDKKVEIEKGRVWENWKIKKEVGGIKDEYNEKREIMLK